MRSGRTSCATWDNSEDEPIRIPERDVSVDQAYSPAIAVDMWPAATARKSRWAIATMLVGACIAGLIASYWSTARAMVDTWIVSSTYAHGFLIAPISAWLIWSRRRPLATLPVRVDPRALPLFAVSGASWLVGRLAGVAALQQFAMVATIPLLVWALLGDRVARALAFPLAFLLLAVPFGDFLLPYLMEQLAGVLVFALRLTGIPVYREGLNFVTPSGNWSIVETCAGLRFMIACMTGGLLYAYLRYRSLSRRVLFVIAAVFVPIVANWMRAYLVVVLDTFGGGRYSIASDHIMYGWLFFGVVTLLLFWAGSRWREDDQAAPAVSIRATPALASPVGALVGVAIAAAALIAVWPVLASTVEGETADATPVLDVPSHAGKWQAYPEAVTQWTPHFTRPAAEVHQAYSDGAQRAGLYVGYYADERHGSKLVSSMNLLVSGNDDWRVVDQSARTVVAGKERIEFTQYRLQGRRSRVMVWQTYWVDGLYTSNPYWAKVLQIRSRLLRHSDGGAVVMLYMPYDDDESKRAADALRGFADTLLPTVTRSLYNVH
jgi:exosortase A